MRSFVAPLVSKISRHRSTCSTSPIRRRSVYSGNASGCFFITSSAKLWKVNVPTLRAVSSPTSPARRFATVRAAESVNVSTRIFSGFVSVTFRMFAMRSVRMCVLPVPGPAITSTGPSTVSTAFFCAGLSLAYARLKACSSFIPLFYVVCDDSPCGFDDLKKSCQSSAECCLRTHSST